MKQLTNTTITLNVSKWDEYNHNYKTDDFVYDFGEPKTIEALIIDAKYLISEHTYGIARLYCGKYQIGAVTKKECEINGYLTDFGKKLFGKNTWEELI